ncbi:unnamed protein product [Prorocentrum cordatum]|uniref:RRM domain-containing protein n=1 Tax=Prorocentrum cordatum TaxID=2364126 RepID=A0ABN9QVA6_9DINO|nr:unnamed protein product [Polarella glacialis]
MAAACGGACGGLRGPREPSPSPGLGRAPSRSGFDVPNTVLLADALEPPVLETPVSRHTSGKMAPIRPPPGLSRTGPPVPVSIASELAERAATPDKVSPLTPELEHLQQQPRLLQLHLHLQLPGPLLQLTAPSPAASPDRTETSEAPGLAAADSTASEDSWQLPPGEQPGQPPLLGALKPWGASPDKRATLVLVALADFPRAATESEICLALDHAIAQYGGLHLVAHGGSVRECRIVRDKGLYGIFEFKSEELAKIILSACSRGNVVMKDAMHKRWYLHASRSRRVTVDVREAADSGRREQLPDQQVAP